MSLAERDSKVIWHPYTQMKTAQAPIGIVRGEGVYLFDEDNKKYIDAVSSWWVNIHGHANAYIAKKVAEQLCTLEHVIFAGFTHDPAITLAEGLLGILPGKQTKIFYTDNGSTAVEVALKMAIQYWHNQDAIKNKIIVFENAYHGDTFGAMSVSGRSAFTAVFDTLLFEVICIPLPTRGNESECFDKLKSVLEKNNDVAAFIFEPLVLGAGGMLMYEPAALDGLLEICKHNDIICIADEVMTGFGRTGKLFASDYLHETPDIICLSKAITGGTMALGATSCNDKIYNAFLSEDKLKTLFHGHSYTANPLACAAGVASLELLLSLETQSGIRRITTAHQNFGKQLARYSTLENVRVTGTIIAFDVKNEEGISYFNSMRDALYQFFLDHGVILRPLGNTLYVMPPYCISDEDLKTVYDLILKRFSEL